MGQTPVLSIGIIFKNEIRCLERCLKSLQPLREAIPCELVMADTGSNDGSREVAKKYADILFDFPWINDFAAARNAVMDRCSGEWYFSIDADEWLDEDLTQLVNCLKKSRNLPDFCAVIIRNYVTANFDEGYSDFLALRIVRMSTGLRYTGAIHEHFERSGNIQGLGRTLLHHDGYVNFSEAQGAEKRERNMQPLRKKLEENPEDMVALLQCIESSDGTWEHEKFIRRGLEGIKKRLPLWEEMGPPILRYAVNLAESLKLSEQGEWIKLAHKLFPNSPFVTIDISYVEFLYLFQKQDREAAIAAGESYLKALEDYRNGVVDASALMHSSLMMVSNMRETSLRNLLADVYINVGKYRKALDVLKKINISKLSKGEIGNYLGNQMNIYAQGAIDTSQAVAKLWETINEKENAVEERNAMLVAAGQCFTPEYRKAEVEKGYRHAYMVFSPLAGKWEPGTAAVILESNSTKEIEKLLIMVKDWNELPIHALAHALECGVRFPLPECPLKIEEMDSLAVRLMQSKENLPLSVKLVKDSEGNDWQRFAWNRGLMIAAVRTFDWSGEENEAGIETVRIFAKTEEKFLHLCYTGEALQEDKLFLLPPMHRFGWYCVRAFETLDAGDAAGYVRCLRKGLSTCEGMKDMVEFLIKHTPGIQTPAPAQELLDLADKVRSMLSAFDPDDPAVAAIKVSPVYQKVAYLIEGVDGGGVPS